MMDRAMRSGAGGVVPEVDVFVGEAERDEGEKGQG